VDTHRFQPDPGADRVGIRRKYRLDADQFTFLYVGRLDGEKRLDVLIETFANSPRNDIQLAICGKGRYEQVLRRQVQALGQERRVKFIGFVEPEDLHKLYCSVDVFAMPSPEELQSIATLEAMASGKPILAANARALPELVQSNVNGYLFTANDPKDAARGIEHLINARDKWAEMGRISSERARLHSLETSLTRYEKHYRMLFERIHIESRKTSSSRKVQNKYV
jgi:glycosyltransferase involved in cell wall biosynthesis